MLEHMKIAAYLEDAGEDPVSACKTLRETGIKNVIIRHVWTSNIKDLSDTGCAKLRKILNDHQITPVAIFSTIGDVPATQLPNIPTETIDRTFNLAAYFGTPILGFTCGQQVPVKVGSQITDWLGEIQQRSLVANLLPLVEITTKSHLFVAADVITTLVKFSRVKLLYDPVQLIIKQNIDPFVKYWTLWKQSVGAIDVRDYKIGRGYKPVGFGDTNIVKTVLDAVRSKYAGWFFFEPSLGRRHGTSQTKGEVFKSAFATFCSVIDQN
jgi:hypothetical protein